MLHCAAAPAFNPEASPPYARAPPCRLRTQDLPRDPGAPTWAAVKTTWHRPNRAPNARPISESRNDPTAQKTAAPAHQKTKGWACTRPASKLPSSVPRLLLVAARLPAARRRLSSCPLTRPTPPADRNPKMRGSFKRNRAHRIRADITTIHAAHGRRKKKESYEASLRRSVFGAFFRPSQLQRGTTRWRLLAFGPSPFTPAARILPGARRGQTELNSDPAALLGVVQELNR